MGLDRDLITIRFDRLSLFVLPTNEVRQMPLLLHQDYSKKILRCR